MARIITTFKPPVQSCIASWDVASMTRCPSTAAIALSCTLAIGAVLVPIVAPHAFDSSIQAGAYTRSLQSST
jgi:hypothetical protein